MSNSANKQTSQTWVPVAGPVLTPEGTPAAPDLVQPHLRHLESRDVTVAPSFPPGDWARTACKAHSPGHLQKAGSVLVIPHVEEVPSLPRLWVITRGTGTWDCGPLLGEACGLSWVVSAGLQCPNLSVGPGTHVMPPMPVEQLQTASSESYVKSEPQNSR